MQPANLKTNLIFGAAWGEAENQDKVDKWINARDLMLPGRGGKRDKMDKWIKQAITRSLLLSASYPRLSTIYPNYPRFIPIIQDLSQLSMIYPNYPRADSTIREGVYIHILSNLQIE